MSGKQRIKLRVTTNEKVNFLCTLSANQTISQAFPELLRKYNLAITQNFDSNIYKIDELKASSIAHVTCGDYLIPQCEKIGQLFNDNDEIHCAVRNNQEGNEEKIYESENQIERKKEKLAKKKEEKEQKSRKQKNNIRQQQEKEKDSNQQQEVKTQKKQKTTLDIDVSYLRKKVVQDSAESSIKQKIGVLKAKQQLKTEKKKEQSPKQVKSKQKPKDHQQYTKQIDYKELKSKLNISNEQTKPNIKKREIKIVEEPESQSQEN